MLREIFPATWWEMSPTEFNKARADLFAMTEAVDRDKDKSLKDVSINTCLGSIFLKKNYTMINIMQLSTGIIVA